MAKNNYYYEDNYNEKAYAVYSISVITTVLLLISLGLFNDARNNEPPEDDVLIKPNEEIMDMKGETVTFPEGEHIILKRINLKGKKIIQLPYHESYSLKGLTADRYVSMAVYVNNEDVIAESNENGEFNDFGISCNSVEKNENVDADYVLYEPGQHILAVPISNPFESYPQVEYIDGYDVIDVVAYYHKLAYGGGYIIYVNSDKVKCEVSNDKGECLTFGTPIEKEKVKTL